VKINGNAMANARAMMADKESAEAAADALNLLQQEFDSLPKDKRAESGLKAAIRAVYKDMSTAVSHERRNLMREEKEDSAATEKLYARLPFRIVCLKSVFAACTHAEFDAHRPTAKNNAATKSNTGDGDTDETDGATITKKNPDKAAQAIAALESALREMTADRDQWRDRAIAAESIIADLNKPAAARKTASKKAKKAA
jgi:hypothetical protein